MRQVQADYIQPHSEFIKFILSGIKKKGVGFFHFRTIGAFSLDIFRIKCFDF